MIEKSAAIAVLFSFSEGMPQSTSVALHLSSLVLGDPEAATSRSSEFQGRSWVASIEKTRKSSRGDLSVVILKSLVLNRYQGSEVRSLRKLLLILLLLLGLTLLKTLWRGEE